LIDAVNPSPTPGAGTKTRPSWVCAAATVLPERRAGGTAANSLVSPKTSLAGRYFCRFRRFTAFLLAFSQLLVTGHAKLTITRPAAPEAVWRPVCHWNRRARHLRLACVAGLFLVAHAEIAAADVAAATPPVQCSLNILLTNDDGWNAPGIRSVRAALLDAGHRVTLMGPLEPQSGKGGAMNTHIGARVRVVQEMPDVWSVDGTPTDAVRAGLDLILRDERPDLLVAGANFGPNLGQEGVHNSGTLGATLAALYEGIPAIAISTGIDPTERDADPPYRSTLDGFSTAAAIVVRTIDALSAKQGCDNVLPGGIALNINVPVPVAAIKGIRYASLARQNLYRMHWTWNDRSNDAAVGYRVSEPNGGAIDDDVRWFNRGFITVTPIDGDVTFGGLPGSIGLPAEPAEFRFPELLQP